MTSRPLLRWAGGKSWLSLTLAQIYNVAGPDRVYVEPFLGGGSAFFSISPKRSILSDINPDLIAVYKHLKQDATRLYDEINTFAISEKDYYHHRGVIYQDPWKSAARFIYLNRLCFGGLYRVNGNGQFNVPYGHKKSLGAAVNLENLRTLSKRLKAAKIKCDDFSKVIGRVPNKSFIFCDPVYTSTKKERFDRYTPNIFSLDKHVQLARSLRTAATATGAVCITSLPMDEEIASLYGSGLWLCAVSRKRSGFDRKSELYYRELLWIIGAADFCDSIRKAATAHGSFEGTRIVGIKNGVPKGKLINSWNDVEL